MKKITFLIHSLNYGGSETQLINLAKGLYKKGHSINVCVFYKGPLEKELEGIRYLPSLGKKASERIISQFSINVLIKKQRRY